MNRRNFVTLLGSTAVWPLPLRAQQADRVRRIGLLMSLAADNTEAKSRENAVREGLAKLGWTDGRNIRFDIRFANGNPERMKANAAELVKLAPDVIVASATVALTAAQRETRTIPIVFAQVTDPVGAGFVASLARPGGNITGFTQHEFSIGVKWLELLKELAPRVEHIVILYDPLNPAVEGYLSQMKQAASTFRAQLSPYPVRETVDIERSFDTVAGKSNVGLIVLPGPSPSVRRDLIVTSAERHRLPAVYPFRYWVMAGGLACYGIDNIDMHRLAASYVDKILRGEKPTDLPVQHATKFELSSTSRPPRPSASSRRSRCSRAPTR